MTFRSTLGASPDVHFREALFSGMAPDGSLYVPASIPVLPHAVLGGLDGCTYNDLCREILSLFIDDIPRDDLDGLIRRGLDFEIPLKSIEPGCSLLELFHGPTHAFKDVGARFMAQAMSYFLSREGRSLTIAVATSGDTGSAVAHGFFGIPNIRVVILYPSGKISRLQEQQMTTLGGNITALEIAGTFDDCQAAVKAALVDPDLLRALNLTTANSINLGRLLPQITYYAWAYAQWKRATGGAATEPAVVVPSGNLGNITAAAYACAMGIPFAVTAGVTNSNDVFARYVNEGVFSPTRSHPTFSNAMDVGNPSNLARLRYLYNERPDLMRTAMPVVSVSDEETAEEIAATYRRTGTVVDPHTAVGIRGGRRLFEGKREFIVASTAHPAKFPEVISKALGFEPPTPAALLAASQKTKQSVRLGAQYEEIKAFLMDEFRKLD